MQRWIGKIAVVTGASAGLGAQIAVDLAKAGLIVIGLARRPQLIDELNKKLPPGTAGKINSYKCDMSKEFDIKKAFTWINQKFGGVDILVNNAAIWDGKMLIDADNSAGVRNTVNTNILGYIFATREAFQTMKNRGGDGHVIIISSTTGRYVLNSLETMGPYSAYIATQFAFTAIGELLRQEFNHVKTKIRVTSILPGAIRTSDFTEEDDDEWKDMPLLDPEDISEAVLFAIGTPPHVQIHELTIRPLGETI